MGLVKRLLEPTIEMKVRFDCPNCENEINDEITDTYFSWGDDPGDGTATEETDLECPDCHHTFTVELIAHATGKQVRVINHPELNVIFHDNTYDSDEAYEDFLDQYEPKDPHAVYKASINELLDLDYGSEIYKTANSAFLKMLYLQYVVVLEAYLSDRLIELVLNDEKALLSLITHTEALRKEKITILEAAKEQQIVKRIAKTYLQNLSFHNLPTVAPMLKAVVGVEIFANDENKRDLIRLIENRHHIVHRNGRDDQGEAISIGDEELRKARRLVYDLVERVEYAFKAYEVRESKSDWLDDDFPF